MCMQEKLERGKRKEQKAVSGQWTVGPAIESERVMVNRRDLNVVRSEKIRASRKVARAQDYFPINGPCSCQRLAATCCSLPVPLQSICHYLQMRLQGTTAAS